MILQALNGLGFRVLGPQALNGSPTGLAFGIFRFFLTGFTKTLDTNILQTRTLRLQVGKAWSFPRVLQALHSEK